MTDEDLGDTLKEYQNNQAADLKNIGNDYFKKGDYASAIKIYKSALEFNPNIIEIWNNLGVAYFKTGNIEEAKQCQEKINLLKKTQISETASKPVSDIVAPTRPDAVTNQQLLPPPLQKPDIDRRPFWLGLFGGIIGIFVAFLGFVLAGFASLGSGGEEAAAVLLVLTLITVIFSLIGMICGITGKSKMSGIFMIFSGIIILLVTIFVGFIASLFFIAGGYILYKNAE